MRQEMYNRGSMKEESKKEIFENVLPRKEISPETNIESVHQEPDYEKSKEILDRALVEAEERLKAGKGEIVGAINTMDFRGGWTSSDITLRSEHGEEAVVNMLAWAWNQDITPVYDYTVNPVYNKHSGSESIRTFVGGVLMAELDIRSDINGKTEDEYFTIKDESVLPGHYSVFCSKLAEIENKISKEKEMSPSYYIDSNWPADIWKKVLKARMDKDLGEAKLVQSEDRSVNVGDESSWRAFKLSEWKKGNIVPADVESVEDKYDEYSRTYYCTVTINSDTIIIDDYNLRHNEVWQGWGKNRKVYIFEPLSNGIMNSTSQV